MEIIVKILKSIEKALKKKLPYDIIKAQKEIQMEVNKMKEIMWQEFNKSDRLVTKRKTFKAEYAMQKFIEKLVEKDNFYVILAIR